MASNTAHTLGPVPGRESRGQRRARLRRRLGAQGWTCPDCGLWSVDPVALRLGFCSRCQEFTGMCSAGRKVVCKDMLSQTTWHIPCTSLGSAAWQLTADSVESLALLCPAHDAEMRAGKVSWIRYAVPLDDLAGD